MRPSSILLASSIALLLACNTPGFGSNGGVTSLTSAIKTDDKAVINEVRDRKDANQSGADATLYFAALGFERALDFEKADAAYEELLRKYSASSYVPYAVFGLGELHLDGLESEHDRYENALGRYRAILQMDGVDDELHALVLVRVAQCTDELGNTEASAWAKSEVDRRFHKTRAGRLVPHQY